MGFPGGASGKEPTCQGGRLRDAVSILAVRKIPWRSAWLHTPVFLPGESPGQRNLVGYSPKSPKESNTTEATEHSTAQAPKVKAERRGLKQDCQVKCQISSSI